MSSSEDYFAIDHLAVKLRLVTEDQLAICQDHISSISNLGGEIPAIEDVLVEKGYLATDDLESLRRLCERYRSAMEDAGYEIIEKVGQGAMGVVYRARQIRMDRVVALKVLNEALSRDKVYVERFLREVTLGARLQHENIVASYDSGEKKGIYYYAMEFVDGPTLGQILRDQGTVDEETAIKIVYQVARALDHASKHNLVHRDIKPDNILLSRDGVAKLGDLGLAKPASPDGASLTQSGQSVGTPFYISPEQAMGSKTIDVRADIYSLGATLFHAVTGKAPFRASSPALVMTMHINEPLPDPLAINRSLSKNTIAIIRKMMAKDPKDRYQTPSDLMDDIESVFSGKSIDSRHMRDFFKSVANVIGKTSKVAAAQSPSAIFDQETVLLDSGRKIQAPSYARMTLKLGAGVIVTAACVIALLSLTGVVSIDWSSIFGGETALAGDGGHNPDGSTAGKTEDENTNPEVVQTETVIENQTQESNGSSALEEELSSIEIVGGTLPKEKLTMEFLAEVLELSMDQKFVVEGAVNAGKAKVYALLTDDGKNEDLLTRGLMRLFLENERSLSEPVTVDTLARAVYPDDPTKLEKLDDIRKDAHREIRRHVNSRQQTLWQRYVEDPLEVSTGYNPIADVLNPAEAMSRIQRMFETMRSPAGGG
ncbi:MAG: serine/threonine protein kinase [Planctomycetes bacterium]|nr:serine/threonine protein kinase [Planctomycetota bacterium]